MNMPIYNLYSDVDGTLIGSNLWYQMSQTNADVLSLQHGAEYIAIECTKFIVTYVCHILQNMKIKANSTSREEPHQILHKCPSQHNREDTHPDIATYSIFMTIKCCQLKWLQSSRYVLLQYQLNHRCSYHYNRSSKDPSDTNVL